jgi:hypothetical protein
VKTTKPIATISFNTPNYLRLKLDELTKAKIISVWHFINHLPEDDEAGKKYHIHLYIEPSKLLQTDDLAEYFSEFDPEKPDKPKKCLPFRISKFGDWYMYSIHDKAYLAAKGQSRRFHYKYDDVITSDTDELYRAVKEIDLSHLTPLREIMKAVEDGMSFSEYLKKGRVPITQIYAYQRAYELIACGETFRNGKETHTPKVDYETGEVIEDRKPIIPRIPIEDKDTLQIIDEIFK